MNDLEYTYAVARVRALETSLLTNAVIEQLLACRTEKECLQLLEEKGWGDSDTDGDAAAMLRREEEKTWEVIRAIAPDIGVFDVFSYSKMYHNLKAAVKAVFTQSSIENIYYADSKVPPKTMLSLIENREFFRLPGNMGPAAEDAYETLIHTRDGQMCDIIIDKAMLEAVRDAGRQSSDEIIKEYAETTVAIADIKIAVRSQKTGKSLDFMKRAMADCDSLNVESLAGAALRGMDSVREYLSGTLYAAGAEALAESPSAFERWCDERIMDMIRPQKYNAFSVGPLVAYLLARENEIKTVRMILAGKQNDFPTEVIRERVREMYA